MHVFLIKIRAIGFFTKMNKFGHYVTMCAWRETQCHIALGSLIQKLCAIFAFACLPLLSSKLQFLKNLLRRSVLPQQFSIYYLG